MNIFLWAVIEVLLVWLGVRPAEIIFSQQRIYQNKERSIAAWSLIKVLVVMGLVGVLAFRA